jgi:hypothetical protein
MDPFRATEFLKAKIDSNSLFLDVGVFHGRKRMCSPCFPAACLFVLISGTSTPGGRGQDKVRIERKLQRDTRMVVPDA